MCHACQTNHCTKARFTRANWTVLRPLLRKASRDLIKGRRDAFDVLFDMMTSRWGVAFAERMMKNAAGATTYYKWIDAKRDERFWGCRFRQWGMK